MLTNILNFLDGGLLELNWWQMVLTFLVMAQATVFGVTIYLHRNQAHRAIDLHPLVSHLFRFWIWLTTDQGTREWVAIHRKHHAHCETPEDPHSPQVLGINAVLWRGVEMYQQSSLDRELVEHYGRGTPNDWLERKLYSMRWAPGVTALFFIEVALFGVAGVAMWALQMAWIPFWAAGVINGLGHWVGYRNFETPDESRNLVPWGLLLGGEELHNNHHAFPSSARFSQRPWEFDVSWWIIRALAACRLARIRRVAPDLPVPAAATQAVDTDSLRALFVHRFHVMTDYYRKVLLPMLHEETEKVGRRARRLLRREERLLDENGRRRLEDLLAGNPALAKAYRLRQRLQAIWTQRTAEVQSLRALQAWCRDAEASGIHHLKEFAARIRSLRMVASPA